jgi:indoleamine 2,3-dioxygenase
MRSLPAAYADVEALLNEMPIRKRDGSPGLLSKGLFGDAVLANLKTHNLNG